MSLEITQEQRGEVRVLFLKGRLDIDSAATLQLAVDDLIATGAQDLLFDFGALGYLSSAGLDVVVSLAERQKKSGGSLRLCALGAAASEMVAASGQQQRLAIFADRKAALADLPQSRIDPELARSAAAIMGAATPQGGKVADKGLARAAAKLLGARGSRPDTPVVNVPEPVAPPPEQPGVLDKLKRLFGNKT